VFPVDDAAALADAMERLAADPRLRARYVADARKRVVDRFAAEIIGRQTIGLYRRLLDIT
jgi:glycosyltransferase involved in cell wall biosynthesis